MNTMTMLLLVPLVGPPLLFAFCIPLGMVAHACLAWKFGSSLPDFRPLLLRRMWLLCFLIPLVTYSGVALAYYLFLLAALSPEACFFIAFPSTLIFWGLLLRTEVVIVMGWYRSQQ